MRSVRVEEIQGELGGAGIPPLWRGHGAALSRGQCWGCRSACFLEGVESVELWDRDMLEHLRHQASFKKGKSHNRLLKPHLEFCEQQRRAVSARELHFSGPAGAGHEGREGSCFPGAAPCPELLWEQPRPSLALCNYTSHGELCN